MTEVYVVSSPIHCYNAAVDWANSVRSLITKGGASIYVRCGRSDVWRVLASFTPADLTEICMRSNDQQPIDETRYSYMKRMKRITHLTSKDILIGV